MQIYMLQSHFSPLRHHFLHFRPSSPCDIPLFCVSQKSAMTMKSTSKSITILPCICILILFLHCCSSPYLANHFYEKKKNPPFARCIPPHVVFLPLWLPLHKSKLCWSKTQLYQVNIRYVLPIIFRVFCFLLH